MDNNFISMRLVTYYVFGIIPPNLNEFRVKFRLVVLK